MIVNNVEIEKVISDKADPGDLYDENREMTEACWEIKLDKEQGQLLFLVDLVEQHRVSLKKLPKDVMSHDNIMRLLTVFKQNGLSALKKELKK